MRPGSIKDLLWVNNKNIMEDKQFTTYKSKLTGKSISHEDAIDEEECIDFVADLIGNGCSRVKVKTSLEINYKVKFSLNQITHLMTAARKQIVDQWEKPPAEFRGTILQSIFNELSNPKTDLRHRIKLQKLLIMLGAQLPDALPSLNMDEWATLTPAQIAAKMDISTVNDK